MSQEDIIQRQLHDWAQHDIGTISSFANMERTLEREYFGRFLIELVQNARDAWYDAPLNEQEAPRGSTAVVRIVLHGAQPVLTVANQGIAIHAQALLAHITQFGESSKQAGTGIGHKGIGLKSILEITRSPQILSRAQPGPFPLAVHFDSQSTEQLIDTLHDQSWAERVAEYDPGGKSDKDQRLPILRFPHWLHTPAALVDMEQAVVLDSGESIDFNTLVRLPHDALLEEGVWLEKVRTAMGALGDEILILLNAFRHVLLEDHLQHPPAHTNITIPLIDAQPFGSGQRRLVEVYRNQHVSSQWLLYKRTVSGLGSGSLDGEITVGVCLQGSKETGWAPVMPKNRTFHLFFPTRIDTGLPFLLHAYFEVDAGRTRFAPDAEAKNQVLLDALCALAVEVVQDLVADPHIDHSSLVTLLAESATQPSDALAVTFRDQLLARLDETPWVCTHGGDVVAPRDVLVADLDELVELLPTAFPDAYLARQANGAAHPRHASAAVRAFLATRKHRDLLDELPGLLRPQQPMWPLDAAETDRGFRALMQVLQIVRTNHPDVWKTTQTNLLGDPQAQFIPVVTNDPGQPRRLLAPSERRRRGSIALFAREQRTFTEQDPASQPADSSDELGVPDGLNMAFLPVDTMRRDVLNGVAVDVGIRPYTTDTVLDQIDRCRGQWPSTSTADIAVFVWRLLLRERVSSFGLKSELGQLARFSPGMLFWLRPQDINAEEKRRKMFRRRGLSTIPLPDATGQWQPAGQLCFGPDWATGNAQRREAYEDLAHLAPSPTSLLASPDVLAQHLPLIQDDIAWLNADVLGLLGFGDRDDINALSDAEQATLHHTLLFLLALSLGVWESPPIAGVVGDLRPEATEPDPWADRPERASWTTHVAAHQRDWFGVSYHKKVRVAADCRLLWPLKQDRDEQQVRMARALNRAAPVIQELLQAPVFCHHCGGAHKYRKWARTPPPSLLAWQLQRTPWVPITINAQAAQPRLPRESWWMSDPPDDPARIATQPRRYLPLVRRGMAFSLIAAIGGHNLEHASTADIRHLLKTLREDFATGSLVIDPSTGGSARQAFIGLHRLLYLRLSKIADSTVAAEILDEVGVLTRLGGALVYTDRHTALYDPGNASVFRRHFYGLVHFVPLNVGEGDVATRLGIGRFQVNAVLKEAEEPEDQTDVLRAFLDERLVEIMALLALMGLGGQTLTPDSEDFRRRSQRLQQLRCFQVPDVILDLTVQIPNGAPIVKTIWEGSDNDVFLRDGRNPALFHDFQGDGWFDKLLSRLGPAIARLAENDAYRDTLSLFFQTPDAAREAFLHDRGIMTSDLQRIRKALDRAGVTTSTLTQTWWTTVLSVLNMPDQQPLSALCAAGLTRAQADQVVDAGGGEDVRRDDGPTGVLTLLSACLDLATLHRELRAAGDPGLRLHWGADQLRRWKNEHGAKVVFALTVAENMAVADARQRLKTWQAPAFAPCPTPETWLASVAQDLRISPLRLLPDCIDAELAALCGVDEMNWEQTWRSLFNEDERSALASRRAQAWRAALRVPAVALLTTPGAVGYRIRSAAERYNQCIPAGLPSPQALSEPLHQLLENIDDAQELLAQVAAISDPLVSPDPDALRHALPPARQAHAEEVNIVLTTRRRIKLDRLRQTMDELDKAGIAVVPHADAPPPPPRKKRRAGQARTVRTGKVKSRNLHKIGAIGEMRALAVVVRPLEALLRSDPAQFAHVIEELKALLVYWDGPAVHQLLAHAAAALDDSRSHEDRLASLVSFVHLSDVSDGFGCDVIGWLPAGPDQPPRPLALEVKTVTSRRNVLISRNEWAEAQRIGTDYALLVIVRHKGAVLGIDLITDPRGTAAPTLTVDTETWRLGYNTDP